ncbi:hypothetical protein [Staphylococcus pseudoxylosus]|uniref:hypothetical protein n=1 Tax=Staphylococcus pseudoxylosus TaxID=2282419 RepID=UPI002DB7505E|nr:hypothetical protein [Staphylococcus pseudoxylosus]MEB7753302.1 hypothetical protein [Staphylococcus pseudoxylosus]
MKQIEDLNIGDIVHAETIHGYSANVTGEVTEIFTDVMKAVIYDGTETHHITNLDKYHVLEHRSATQHYQSNADDGIDLIDFWTCK